MKNLHIIQTNKVSLDASIVSQCIDADSKRLFLLTKDVKVFEVQGGQKGLRQCELPRETLQAIGITNIEIEDVVSAEYVVETGSILVALKAGQLIRLGVSTFSPPSGCVYSHDKQICSLKLSPDQDLIALADVDNEILILSADFVPVHSNNALIQNDSAHKPVGVGWGSKETQFFGLDGRPSKEKASKDQVVLETEELSAIEKIESSDIFKQFRQGNEINTVVDWRGDGQLLATFTFIPDCGKHYLKVWNRNLELQYMSEQLVTMERGLLSWIPNGQYVCAAQRRDNRVNELAMFEKNGMVHQRITLPTFIPHLYIKSMLWSPDSATLAIIVVLFEVAQSQINCKHMLYLYAMQNFHYYLKYSSQLTLGGSHYSMRWDPNHNNILYVASESGSCVEYNCTTTVDLCGQETTVAVIDANRILLTPFKICNIPPPMSAINVEFPTLINRLLIGTGKLSYFFVITVDNKLIYLVSSDEGGNDVVRVLVKIENDLIRQFSHKLGPFKQLDFRRSEEHQNFTVIGHDLLIATQRCKGGTEVLRLQINFESNQLERLVVTVLEGREVIFVVQDSYNPYTESIQLITDDYSCQRITLSSGETSTRFVLKTTADRLYIKEAKFIEQFDIVLTLTLDQTLRVNEHVIVSNCCTSFGTTSCFLIYTTIDHTIHFLPLDRLTSWKSGEELGSWNQPIENGGTLVIASEDESKVILQMPRGNLEILHPRLMVLLRLTNLLDEEEYLDALKLARRYRVDLNFLPDYMLCCDEEAFYKQKLAKFANSIAQNDPALLNLLITELTSDDTTRNRYQSAMKYLPACGRLLSDGKAFSSGEKVNKICSTIELPDETKFLQPKLLCLLKQEPNRTDDALRLIHELPDKEGREAALRFLLYFISIEQLFSDAIATHDTDIALMVAGVSSKDPKEYLALLDEFNQIDNVHLRRYTMDLHIKNYERAFTNLLIYFQDAPNNTVKADLLDLVVSKRIYKHAIKSCFEQFVNFISLIGNCKVDNSFRDLFAQIWTKYGDYLLEKRYYLEAGIAYCKSQETQPAQKSVANAIKCFLLVNDWERCLAVVARYELDWGEMKLSVLKNLENSLMSQGKCVESFVVLNPKRSDEIAEDLVQKDRWFLAEYCVDSCRPRVREQICRSISNHLDSALSSLTEDLDTAREQFKRLKEVLLTPPKTDFIDGDNCYTADSLSTIDGSETTSNSSARGDNPRRVARSGAPSIKTRMSAKSSKSQASKRRRVNLKVGSRHEDLALAGELRKFVSKQKSVQERVRDLIAAHIEFTNFNTLNKQHETINRLLRESHDLAQEILTKLWPKLDSDTNVYSLYKRFSKTLSTGDYVDNLDLEVLLRPDLPGSCLLFDF